eukprot:4891667-Pyramimonas_sp.AAC.1
MRRAWRPVAKALRMSWDLARNAKRAARSFQIKSLAISRMASRRLERAPSAGPAGGGGALAAPCRSSPTRRRSRHK